MLFFKKCLILRRLSERAEKPLSSSQLVLFCPITRWSFHTAPPLQVDDVHEVVHENLYELMTEKDDVIRLQTLLVSQ